MKQFPFFVVWAFFVSFFGGTTVFAESMELQVDEWVHLPDGLDQGPSLKTDWEGKVVYLYFFQSWCPGCHSSGFPTLKALLNTYEDQENIRFAAVQTVFEGFHTNTPEAAQEIVERYGLHSIPVGQSGTADARSKVMRDFKTRGTPWTVILDSRGEVVYSGFHLDVEKGKRIIEGLL